MRFEYTKIEGAVIIDIDPISDDRGFFARSFCEVELTAAGLNFQAPQNNIARNYMSRTLRGVHYRSPENAEAKIVRVTRGKIFDVAVDVRPDSPTYRQWVGLVLDAESGRSFHLAEGLAHGFVTLEPDTDVHYLMNKPYNHSHEFGIRWDDPAIGIDWPVKPYVISDRDANYPDLCK